MNYLSRERRESAGSYDKVTRLENGLTIATAEMPHMASVSVGLWVGIGARYESPEVNGVCHFIEHLLFKGTKKRTPGEISQAVEGIGGYLNAFTSEEATCFHSRACHDQFATLIEVLMDMFLSSRFAKPDIDKESDVIKEEIAMYLDQPQHHVQELLNRTLWPNHPLGRPITGTPATLDRMTRDVLVGYLRKHYLASNSLLVAAGRLDHDKIVRQVRRYAAKFQVGVKPGFSATSDTQTKPRLSLFTSRTEQTQIALGIRTCSRHDPRRFALRLLNTILGENMSSRLFQVIREDLGLAYSIYSNPSFFEDTGDLVVSAGLDTDNIEKVIKLVLEALRRLAEKPVSPGELRRAKDYVIGQMQLSLESTDNRMNWVGEQLLSYGRVIHPGEIKRRLVAVSPSQILEAAQEFFRPERLNLALVSPLKSLRHADRLLRL